MADWSLRFLAPEDLPGVLEIETASFPDDPWTLENFLDELDRPFSILLGLFPEDPGGRGPFATRDIAPVAGPDLEGAASPAVPPPAPVAAYAVFWFLYGETHILNLAVAPALRGRGLGRMILKAALDLSRAKGMKRALLECRENNLAAMALYRSEGFLATGRRRGYYEHGRTDAILMTLPLRGGRKG
jgi:ribosomal-protein-alanine acetyltransferase